MTGGAFSEVAAQGPNTPFQFLMGLMARPVQREREAQAAQLGMQLAQEMAGKPGSPAMPAVPSDKAPGVGRGRGGQPAVAEQPAVPGKDFSTAIMGLLTRDPALLGRLANAAFDDPTTLRQVLMGADTNEAKNLKEFKRLGGTPTIEQQGEALGVLPDTPEKMRIWQGLAAVLGREPTIDEAKEYFNLNPPAGTTVNVMPPDLGPVFSFINQGQVADRQNNISKINMAMSSVNDIVRLTTLPAAKMLFGPVAKAADLTAPFADLLGAEQAFGFLGPNIKTLGQARSASAIALSDAARTVVEIGGRDLSKRELELAGQILANPDAFLTSATQVNSAALTLSKALQRLQTAQAGELSQGGTQPTEGSVNPNLNPEVSSRAVKRAQEILRADGIKEGEATDEQLQDALDKALLEIIGQNR